MFMRPGTFLFLTEAQSLSFVRERFDRKAEALKLLDQHPEGSRDTGLFDRLCFDNGLIGLDPALDVVRLNRQHFLQGVRCAVGLQRPDFHLPETLTAELRLTTQRLLGNQRIGAGGAGVDLVFDQVVKLHHQHDTDRHRLVVRLTRLAVE